MMNILIKLTGFRGGAPISMRQYQQVLHGEGDETVVCGLMESGKEEENVFLNDTPCYNVPPCSEKSFFNVIKITLTLFNLIKKHKSRVLISTSRTDFGVCRAVCKATGSAFLPIIPGGKISKNAKNLSSVKKERFICFSFENKEALMANGIPNKNISVVSNRIKVIPDLEWRRYYSEKSENQPIEILLVSRLDPEHKEGIMLFMDRLSKYKGKIILNIAGDGTCANEYHDYAKKIDKENKFIKFLGFVKDMDSVIRRSDIIIGKGRSVLTPIMTNRIGFVLGYDGGITVCNEETFDELYRYNFSGRNSTHTLSDDQFFDMCDRIRRDENFRNSFDHVFEVARKHYSVEYLKDMILPIINDKKAETKKVKYGFAQKFKAVLFAIAVYFRWLLAGIAAKVKG